MASIVLPTPGGPRKSKFAAVSRNRSVASSRIRDSSTPGWALKSKSAIRQGAGRQANRSRLASRLRFACLPAPWRIADFDFSAQPGVDESLIRELATLRFLDTAANLLFLGPPGVGKTMLAIGLARLCLLYTSDAADEEDSVDLGGRRIIKKKKKNRR